jgi:photosystem II stability/assembly factor-like uncharacterized protein
MHWSLGGCSTGSEAWSGSGCYFSGTLNAGYLGDLVATSPTTAFIAGGRNDVLVTRDGGRTWAQTAPPIGDMDSGTGPLCFADPDHGWAVAGAFNAGPANALWSTTDGGRTWTAVWRSVTKG